MSGSQIKIMEPGAVGVGPGGAQAGPPNEGERLVVITGQPQNIQMAVGLLYHVRFSLFTHWLHSVLTNWATATRTREAKADAEPRLILPAYKSLFLCILGLHFCLAPTTKARFSACEYRYVSAQQGH